MGAITLIEAINYVRMTNIFFLSFHYGYSDSYYTTANILAPPKCRYVIRFPAIWGQNSR